MKRLDEIKAHLANAREYKPPLIDEWLTDDIDTLLATVEEILQLTRVDVENDGYWRALHDVRAIIERHMGGEQ